LAAKLTPPEAIVEFMALPAGFSASVSAWPLKVTVSLAMPASPSKVSSPALVATVPVAGVWKGAIVVENGMPPCTVPRPS
jgi:hypothetical protein